MCGVTSLLKSKRTQRRGEAMTWNHPWLLLLLLRECKKYQTIQKAVLDWLNIPSVKSLSTWRFANIYIYCLIQYYLRWWTLRAKIAAKMNFKGTVLYFRVFWGELLLFRPKRNILPSSVPTSHWAEGHILLKKNGNNISGFLNSIWSSSISIRRLVDVHK